MLKCLTCFSFCLIFVSLNKRNILSNIINIKLNHFLKILVMKKQVRLSFNDSLIVKFHLENEVERLRNIAAGDSEYTALFNDRINALESIISKLC